MPALSKPFEFVINTGTSTATSVAIPSAAIAPDGGTRFRSNPEKGDGYFGSADGVHTVTFTVTPYFAGSMNVQASLATEPVESDWFDVYDTTISYSQPNVPASTTTHYVNFIGNFVWVRAVVNRSDDDPNGSVMFINYNH